VATIVIVVALGVLLFGGWWIYLRRPPQVMPPGIRDPAKLTEDIYAGRYRPGVGYVDTPRTAPAPGQPGAPPR
jgi:hypothetical protein